MRDLVNFRPKQTTTSNKHLEERLNVNESTTQRNTSYLGSCHKVWNRGGRKGFDRVTKTIGWKPLGYQTSSSDKNGPQSYLFRDFFQCFTIALNTVSVIFAVLLITDIVFNLSV